VVDSSDGQAIEHGTVYVARPDHHLLVEEGRLRVVMGPKENRRRPAADALFRSAALAYGPRVVGVVLTGALDDGTAGLHAIKRRGGVAVVQDPEEADFPSMPRTAIENVDVDHVLRLADMPATLVRLAGEPAGPLPRPARELVTEVKMAAGDMEDVAALGRPSTYGCPECGGVLWEIDDQHLLRFRCRVGHAYGAESLLAEQDEGVEDALWAALRALEENTSLQQRVASRLRNQKQEGPARRVEERARAAERHAEQVRRLLGSLEKPAVGG
jgi:two-component system chemotaxis response regulator CheB